METYKILTEDNLIYPMGMTVMGNRIHVSAANEGESCSLALFRKQEQEPFCVIPMSKEQQIGNVWNLTVEMQTAGEDLEYCLEIDGKLVPDIYAHSLHGWEQWGRLANVEETLRSPVCQDTFDWEGDKPLCLPFEDSIIYRIHTRGFT